MKTRKEHLKSITRIANPGGNRIDYVRLDKNERTVAFASSDWKQMIGPLIENPEWITVYPEVRPLIEKIAKWDRITPDQVFLTAGSDLALKACFEAFVRPGDKVVVLDPTFAMGNIYCKLFQAKEVLVPCEMNMSFSSREIMRAVDEETALVYLPNPNSPTGGEFSLNELETIIQHCQSKSTPIFVDEAYYYFSKTTAISLINRYENLIVGRTFSKACGMAGIRLGYAAGQKETVELMAKWRPMYEVNSFAVHFGSYLAEHPTLIDQYVDRVNAAKSLVMDWCHKWDVPFFQSFANFINVKVGEANAKEIEKICMQNKVLLRAGGSYKPGPECVRISLGVPEQVNQVLPLMESVLKLKR